MQWKGKGPQVGVSEAGRKTGLAKQFGAFAVSYKRRVWGGGGGRAAIGDKGRQRLGLLAHGEGEGGLPPPLQCIPVSELNGELSHKIPWPRGRRDDCHW